MTTPNQRPGDEELKAKIGSLYKQATKHPEMMEWPGVFAERIMELIKHRETEAEERGLVKGIKLVDEALLDDVTGTYPVQMVRTLIKLLVWENTPPDKRSNSSQLKN